MAASASAPDAVMEKRNAWAGRTRPSAGGTHHGRRLPGSTQGTARLPGMRHPELVVPAPECLVETAATT
jgi:hypothetical protein